MSERAFTDTAPDAGPVEPDFDVDATTLRFRQLEARNIMKGALAGGGIMIAVPMISLDIKAENDEQTLQQRLSETPRQATVKTQAIQEQIKDAENRQSSGAVLEGIGGAALLLTTVFVAGLYQTRKLRHKFREAGLRVPTIWPDY